jgi:hypothetical protein
MKQLSMVLTLVLGLGALQVNAQQTKVLIDNEKLKVTEYISQPGKDVCGAGMHTHQDHATILTGDAKVKTTKADGTAEVETYSAAKHVYNVARNGKTESIPTDGTFWVKGATHSVINISDKPLKFYIVETKQ